MLSAAAAAGATAGAAAGCGWVAASTAFGADAGAAAGVAEAAAGAAVPLPSESIIAITVFTGTTSPSLHRSSTITPDAGAGISESTLSVEISRIISSFVTASPTFFEPSGNGCLSN